MDKKKYNLPVFGQSNPMGSPMEMDDKKRERVLKAANSKGVNSSGLRGFLLLASIPPVVITLVIVFVPGVADWMDGWSPLTVTVCVMIICLLFYLCKRNITR